MPQSLASSSSLFQWLDKPSLHHIALLSIGLNLSYTFKYLQGIPIYFLNKTLLCLFLNLIILTLSFILQSSVFKSFAFLKLFKDKSIIALTLSVIIINFELFWQPYLLEFPASSLTGSILLYLGSLLPMLSYAKLGDQVLHWILISVYSVIAQISSDAFAPELALAYSLGLIPLVICINGYMDLQKKSSKTHKPPSDSVLHGLLPLLLENTENIYVLINKEQQIVVASKAFTDMFKINPEFLRSHYAKETMERITNVACAEKIKELAMQQELAKGSHKFKFDSKRCEDGNNAMNKNTSLAALIELIFTHAQAVKENGIGWNQHNQTPKMFATQAYIDDNAKSFNMQFTFIEDSDEDLLLFRFDLGSLEGSLPVDHTLSVTEIASIVHDLRTPLNGSIFFLQQAIHSSGSSSQVKQDFLEPSLQAAKRLNFIINDLLDFAQILEGKFKVSLESFDLEQTLQCPLKIIRALGNSKGIAVHLDIDSNVPKFITSDQNRLVQIVYNLLGNAFKFTKEGSIRLHVSLSQTSTQHIEFAVKDTGFGIKPEDLNKLFQAFEKLDNWHDNKVGTGLGLCISNAIAKSLGGKSISVKSEHQRGSTFSFAIEDKFIQKLYANPSQNTIKQSIFAPEPGKMKKQSSKNSSLKRKTCDDLSLRESILKGQKAQPRLPKLESSELFTEIVSPVGKNPTVHYDFNNPSSHDGDSSIFKRQSRDERRQPNTIIDFTKRLSKDNDLFVEKFRRSTLQPEKTYSRSEVSSPSCSCYQIIAIDDEPMNLMALKILCLDLGLGILFFARGEDAIEYYKKGEKRSRCLKCTEPLLILMDCHMPGKDGYETATELKDLMQNGKMPSIPIYACSADESPILQETVVKRGMAGSIAKPVSRDTLLSLVKYCNNYRKQSH